MIWSIFNGCDSRAIGRIIDLIQDEVDELNKGEYLVTFSETKYIDFVVINVKISIGGYELTLVTGELGKSYRLFSPMVDDSGLIVMGKREGYIGSVESNSLFVGIDLESNIQGFIRDAYTLLVNTGGYDLGYSMDELSKVGYIRDKSGDTYFMVKDNPSGSVKVYFMGDGSLQLTIDIGGFQKVITKDFSWLGSDEFFEFNLRIDKLINSYESYKFARDELLKGLDSNFNEALGKDLSLLS